MHLEEERLRDEPRRGTVVVVGVRDIVRVELGLVVEVEVRSVAELTIAIIGNMPLSIYCTGGRGLLYFDLYPPSNPLNFIRRHLYSRNKKPATDKASSISSRQHAFGNRNLRNSGCFMKREFGDSHP